MKKVEVSIWENLDRDILDVIFDKLDMMDITMGASRVCISWFIASHNKTLWNTVDLCKVQLKAYVEPFVLFKPIETLVLYKQNLINDGDESGVTLMELLNEISKFSRMVPKTLFFNAGSQVEEYDLTFAAEKMPNIEKLFIPIQCFQTKESSWFAFSQWKNLTTLIISHNYSFTGRFDFQAVGENCSNLTNLKYISTLQEREAKEIVSFLQSLKRLSLRNSSVSINGVLKLIKGLKKLTILNLSHCKVHKINTSPMALSRDKFVRAASQKLKKIITCSQECRMCNDDYYLWWSSLSEDWKNDEIKELEF